MFTTASSSPAASRAAATEAVVGDVERQAQVDVEGVEERDVAGGGHHLMAGPGQLGGGGGADGPSGTGDQDAHGTET